MVIIAFLTSAWVLTIGKNVLFYFLFLFYFIFHFTSFYLILFSYLNLISSDILWVICLIFAVFILIAFLTSAWVLTIGKNVLFYFLFLFYFIFHFTSFYLILFSYLNLISSDILWVICLIFAVFILFYFISFDFTTGCRVKQLLD